MEDPKLWRLVKLGLQPSCDNYYMIPCKMQFFWWEVFIGALYFLLTNWYYTSLHLQYDLPFFSKPSPNHMVPFIAFHPTVGATKAQCSIFEKLQLGQWVVALWLPCFLKTSVLAGTLCIVSSLQKWRNHTSLPMCVSITVCSVRKASLMSSLNSFSQQFELFFLISMLWTRSILFFFKGLLNLKSFYFLSHSKTCLFCIWTTLFMLCFLIILVAVVWIQLV